MSISQWESLWFQNTVDSKPNPTLGEYIELITNGVTSTNLLLDDIEGKKYMIVSIYRYILTHSQLFIQLSDELKHVIKNKAQNFYNEHDMGGEFETLCMEIEYL